MKYLKYDRILRHVLNNLVINLYDSYIFTSEFSHNQVLRRELKLITGAVNNVMRTISDNLYGRIEMILSL